MSADAVGTAPVVAVTPDGLAPAVWADALTGAAVWDPASVGDGPLLVLSAHPDDETIGFGRSIARWARTSGPVDLLTLTAGEACLDAITRSSQFPLPTNTRAAIGNLRRDEFTRAGAALGVRSTRCRDLPDSALADFPDRVVVELDCAVSRSRPVLLAAPWASDPHPDHAVVGAAAAEVAARHSIPLVEYPVWASFWKHPPWDEATSARLSLLPADPVDEDRREAAIRCYPSQYSSFFAGLGPVVPDSMLQHHRRAFAFRPHDSIRPHDSGDFL